MASFKALNIESEDESADEIDNTKEIQIEEALKDYQTALKYQSQGPRYIEEAGIAFETLFKSDIFKYPESQSEYRREEDTDGQNDHDADFLRSSEISVGPTPGTVDNATSALPQILHLSYKNRGEHHLDLLNDLMKKQDTQSLQNPPSHAIDPKRIQSGVANALNDFTEALDKDEGDTDLWRRASRLSQVLNSSRISRYCLESAAESDEEGTDDVLGIMDMTTNIAGRELKQLEESLDDKLSLSQLPYSISSAKEPPLFLRNHLSMYRFLPQVSLGVADSKRTLPFRRSLNMAEDSWAALGQAILQHLLAEQSGLLSTNPGAATSIHLPTEGVAEIENVARIEPLLDASQLETVPDDVDGTSTMTSSQTQILTANKITIADAIVEQSSIQTASSNNNDHAITVALPMRKRSSEAAELPDTPEGGRVRSKRIRARESTLGESRLADGNGTESTPDDEKLQASIYADQWLFEVLGDIIERAGAQGLAKAQSLRSLVSGKPSDSANDASSRLPLRQAIQDFYAAIQNWTESKTQLVQQYARIDETNVGTRNAGLLAFLEQSHGGGQKAAGQALQYGIRQFVQTINEAWMTITESALAWIRSVISGKDFAPVPGGDEFQSNYTNVLWSDTLKQTVVQMIIAVDELLFQQMLGESAKLSDNVLIAQGRAESHDLTAHEMATIEMIQTLFELHLDIYSRITNPASEVDSNTCMLQKDRLDRWCDLARDVVNLRPRDVLGRVEEDSLTLRHLWSSVFHLQTSEGTAKAYLISCIEDLKRVWKIHGDPLLELPNNAIMPKLSMDAANKEISKLKTMDFFLKIFNKDDKNPLDLIESLEPILDPSSTLEQSKSDGEDQDRNGTPRVAEHPPSGSLDRDEDENDETHSSARVLSKFLESANATLRLSLWRRLREAYEAIDYPPKVFSILLRSIEIIVGDLSGLTYTEKTKEERESMLLNWLCELHDLILRALTIVDGHPNAFECIDLAHLRSSINGVASVFSLLHTVSLYDDYSQIVCRTPPLMNPFRTYPIESFHTAAVKYHDMHIRTAILLYKMLQEAMAVLPDRFPKPAEFKMDYLRHVHHAFGVRRLCKASDSVFLHFMKDEFLSSVELRQQSPDELAQILYDLYDLHCFSSPLQRRDHGCEADYLDRRTALLFVDFVMEKARQVNLKDLLKSDLGKTIERVHSALGIFKGNFTTNRNRKMYNSYMKSSINPMDLYSCMRGIGELSTLPVSAEEAVVASKGWYFLKGQIALMRYRSQKSRGTPGPTEDLHVAVALFVQDLEFSTERWETWYRIAQANDSLIEEHVKWSAEKINAYRTELAQEQRASIHAYVMAVASALRSAEPSTETSTTMAELYSDFGNLIYSCSRPPFSMQAFSLGDFTEKHFSGSEEKGDHYTRRSFRSLKAHTAWKIASVMFKRAIQRRPNYWMDHLMLGKCFWKLHKISSEQHNSDLPQFCRLALDAFTRAVETTPERKDTNRQDPILEPIYKLVSIVHKLVGFSEMDHEIAALKIEDVLIKQKQFEVQKTPALGEFDSWESYILEVLRILRVADKSRWHHRLVFRAGHIMYDKHGRSSTGAKIAKEYLIDQHMYSAKTLALAIWKPDNERAGRHWFYMKQYAQFLILLLEQTDDLEAIQTLARRVRKKTNEFFEHTQLWDELCAAHVMVHRRHGNIPDHYEDIIFKHIMHEEFEPRAALVDQWCTSLKTSHVLADVLRETVELKKLNGGLAKTAAIDDLIADTYAAIYSRIGPTLELAKAVHAPMPTPTSPLAEERRNVMSMTNLINVDGAIEIKTPASLPVIPLVQQDLIIKPRPKPVLKREILKHATDAINAKPPPTAPAPILPLRSPLFPGVRVIINTKSDAQSRADEPAAETGTAASSEPGSVHDSADDESELSEPDPDTTFPKPMFPNLKGRETTSETPVKHAIDGSAQMDRSKEGDGDIEMS